MKLVYFLNIIKKLQSWINFFFFLLVLIIMITIKMICLIFTYWVFFNDAVLIVHDDCIYLELGCKKHLLSQNWTKFYSICHSENGNLIQSKRITLCNLNFLMTAVCAFWSIYSSNWNCFCNNFLYCMQVAFAYNCWDISIMSLTYYKYCIFFFIIIISANLCQLWYCFKLLLLFKWKHHFYYFVENAFPHAWNNIS